MSDVAAGSRPEDRDLVEVIWPVIAYRVDGIRNSGRCGGVARDDELWFPSPMVGGLCYGSASIRC